MDLDAWVDELDGMTFSVNSNIRYVMEGAIKQALPEARAKLPRFAEDGNSDAQIYTEVTGSRGDYTAFITLIGEDAEFVEYGYGAVAEETYPPGDPWEYDINGHGYAGWYYAHGKKSRGLPAGAVLYRMTEDIQETLDNPWDIINAYRSRRRRRK